MRTLGANSTLTRLRDNGSCYQSHVFAGTLAAAGIAHQRTRPYRPHTNDKVERFNLTLKWEWAYARTYLTNVSWHQGAHAVAPRVQLPSTPALRGGPTASALAQSMD